MTERSMTAGSDVLTEFSSLAHVATIPVDRLSLFDGVSAIRLAKLDAAMWRVYEPGAALATEGECADHLYVIERGQVSITARGQIMITRGPNDIVGEQAFIEHTLARRHGHGHHASSRTPDPSRSRRRVNARRGLCSEPVKGDFLQAVRRHARQGDPLFAGAPSVPRIQRPRFRGNGATPIGDGIGLRSRACHAGCRVVGRYPWVYSAL